MSHTPGPWEVRHGIPSKENLVCNVRGLEVWGPYQATPCIEDANLIAAAPDLLAVAELGLQLAKDWVHDERVDLSSEIFKLESAISKAKGGIAHG